MKKKKPQSQRKSIHATYQGNQGNNICKKNKSNLNTFRQNKDNNVKILTNKDKRNLNKSHKESPRTIDYIQIMNKYSHLMEQNQDLNSKNIEENNSKYKYNNYYLNTEINQDKNINKEMPKSIHYSNINKRSKDTGINNNDEYFQFCWTDYEKNEKEDNQNIFKYYTSKNFYQNKKNETNGCSGRNNLKKINKNIIKNEDNKSNNIIYNSYNKDKNAKNKEKIYFSNMDDNKNRTHFFNNNICNSVSLRKMSKRKNSTNSHSLGNINVYTNKANESNLNRVNFNNNDVKQNLRNINIASPNELFCDTSKNKNEETKEMNQKMFNYNYYSEKIITLITLCQKYAKVLNSSLSYVELNHNNNNDSLDELKYIINQFNKLMFSDKINNFFNNKNNKNHISNYNLSEFEPKTLNLTEKFKSKIKDLKTEKSDLNDELLLYKKKYKTLVLEKEELDLVIKKLTKENEELSNQNKNLKNLESKCYHQINMINKLNCQIETLNIDIKYKENIINNLQQILEQLKIKSNIIHFNNIANDSDIMKFNKIKSKSINKNIINNYKKMNIKELEKDKEYNFNGLNNISDFLLDVESIEKDIIFPKNLKVNSIEDSININIEEGDKKKNKNDSEIIINDKKESENVILKLKQNLKAKNQNNSVNNCKKTKLYFNQNEEPEIFNKEMEKIDQDILNLKTKLKKIMTK